MDPEKILAKTPERPAAADPHGDRIKGDLSHAVIPERTVHYGSGQMKWIGGKSPPQLVLITLFPLFQPGEAIQPLATDNHPPPGLQPCMSRKPRLIITGNTDFQF